VLLDAIDCLLLNRLQRDATMPLTAVAEEAGIRADAVTERLARLASLAIIEGQVAMVDNEKVGLPLTVFIHLQVDHPGADTSRVLARLAEDIPEIMEFYGVAGGGAYIMKLIVADTADQARITARFHNELAAKGITATLSASITEEKLKFTTQLPIQPQAG